MQDDSQLIDPAEAAIAAEFAAYLHHIAENFTEPLATSVQRTEETLETMTRSASDRLIQVGIEVESLTKLAMRDVMSQGVETEAQLKKLISAMEHQGTKIKQMRVMIILMTVAMIGLTASHIIP